MLMRIGFEKPTLEIMAAWGKRFARVAPLTIEYVGLRGGREITQPRTADLTMGRDSITGYTFVSTDNIDEAQQLAASNPPASNPFVSAIRICELMTH
jgi:hypothetical protein